MDVKEARIEAALNSNIHDDCTKYMQNREMPETDRDKAFSEIVTHSSGKTDTRPCAIIGPDRVVPPTCSNELYMKANAIDPWEYSENYRYPYDPIKMSEYHPTRNISPRQTFQENMQRIMVPPTYSSIKNSDDPSLKNVKLNNMQPEVKYCDVPYINTLSSEHKSVRSGDNTIPTSNPSFSRSVPPHGWHAGIGMRPIKPYPAPDYYQHPDYSNCAGPRAMPMIQPQRIVHDELLQFYPDRLYPESNVRFKPYPMGKERFPQSRYDYIGANTFHPPHQIPLPKFESQKSMNNHHYSMYSQGPLKYVDRRYPEPIMEGYQRPNTQHTLRNQPIPSSYGPLSGNSYQSSKSYPCPSENKPMHVNKLSFESNNKVYLELESSRSKGYPLPDNFYYNERAQVIRGDVLLSNHQSINSMPPQQLCRKDNPPSKNYDYVSHYRYRDQHLNMTNTFSKLPLQFSPNTIAISPCDSNTSNDTQMLGVSQEDCGYGSQSSTTSVKSLDSNGPVDYYKRSIYNYGPTTRSSAHRDNINSRLDQNSSEKKGLNVRQFLQMWNEGDDEDTENNKESISNTTNCYSSKPSNNTQEPLYVLEYVNIPKEELSKYEHVQKISKLPENIKGYNDIEILNQYEQLVESPNVNNYDKPMSYKMTPKNYTNKQMKEDLVRPPSPLDVEAKISQSVIHKEVGCNFEIKPCSPKVLNVDIATPVHDILGERLIEKVSNPIMRNIGRINEGKIDNAVSESMAVSSCEMMNSLYSSNTATVRPSFPLQDLETNMSVCLASLPQLDNEIEFNLPEVNQQFINANKNTPPEESKVLVNSLETNQQNNTGQNKLDSEKVDDTTVKVVSSRSDKEILKLSKYRKTKRPENALKDCGNLQFTQRTDSVIIKNPENMKVESIGYDPPETISPNYKSHQENVPCITDDFFYKESMKVHAIDFSLNKNENIMQYKCKAKHLSSDSATTSIINMAESSKNSNFSSKLGPMSTNEKIELNTHEDKEPVNVSESKCDSKEKPSRESSSIEDQLLKKSNIDCEINADNSIVSANEKENLVTGNRETECNEVNDETEKSKTEEICTVDSEAGNVKKINLCSPNNRDNEMECPSVNYNYVNQLNDPIYENSDVSRYLDVNDFTEKNIKVDKLNDGNILEDKSKSIENISDCLNNANVNNSISESSELTSSDRANNEACYTSENYAPSTNCNSIVIANFEEIDIKTYDHNLSKASNESEKQNVTTNKNNEVKPNVKINSFNIYQPYILKKELYSPWIQKLILNIEGKCIIPNYLKEKKNLKESKIVSIHNKSNNQTEILENDNDFGKVENEIENFYLEKKYGENDVCSTTKNIGNKNKSPEHKDYLIDSLDDTKKPDIEATEMHHLHNKYKKNSDNDCNTIYNLTTKGNSNNANSSKEIIGAEKHSEKNEVLNLNDPVVSKNADNNNAELLSLPNDYKSPMRRTCKRSLSETALDMFIENKDNNYFLPKRSKNKEENYVPSQMISTNLCSIIQTNRRNSISEIYSDGNVFILIDNDFILTNEDEAQKIFADVESIHEDMECNNDNNIKETRTLSVPWAEDIDNETIFADDIAENIEIPAPLSPIDSVSSENESLNNRSPVLYDRISDNVGKNVNDSKEIICNSIAIETSTEYPDISGNQKTKLIESQSTEIETKLNENILEDNASVLEVVGITNDNSFPIIDRSNKTLDNKENLIIDNNLLEDTQKLSLKKSIVVTSFSNVEKYDSTLNLYEYQNEVNNFLDQSILSSKYSSSPEVTSTTCEDKNGSYTISNNKRCRIAETGKDSDINKKISYKLTEKKNYKSYNPNFNSTGTLITKAAQKYIPPLKITMSDLKVKLPLPQKSLNKLKQLKESKAALNIDIKPLKPFSKIIPHEIKKQKPKFEDVLMSIDEIQFKKHKDKNRKTKKEIPKVVIKKNETGAHYTSLGVDDNDKHNPDLTGRKWQPWVFIEKNNFIDRMALKNKVKAIYCRRKNTYVLAEKFRKYKSVYNAKFVISQPKSDNSSKGNLKYTIRLKHN